MYFTTLYRAFQKQRQETRKDKDCSNLRQDIRNADLELSSLTTTKLNIKIDEKWILEVEEGIRHISEAVNQERQFIRTSGDVVPIEKVKRVSVASIVHLARHSELITKMPEEGEILIPDKVYMEEKLSDYTVYENRFLYTLLIYLEQFVNMRLDKIKETINTYQSNLNINKKVESKYSTMNLELSFFEERRDTINNLVTNDTLAFIDRLEMVSRELISLLSCNLMKEVSKSPLVKPPLVKTNILKNNKNFKAAVLLYDFINIYNEDGYVIEEIKEIINPFSIDIADEYAEIISCLSMLTYKNSNKLNADFKKELEVYERLQQQKIEDELKEKINKFKNRLANEGISTDEYLLLLEKRNDKLEQDILQVNVLQSEINELKDSYFELEKTISDLNNKIEHLDTINYDQEKEIATLKQENEKLSYRDEWMNRNLQMLLEESYLEGQKHQFEVGENILSTVRERSNEVDNKNQLTIRDKDNEIKELKSKLQIQKDKFNLATAQLIALKQLHEIDNDDHSEKENFKQLEEQYYAFEKFFNEEWKKAKKKIRKQYLK